MKKRMIVATKAPDDDVPRGEDYAMMGRMVDDGGMTGKIENECMESQRCHLQNCKADQGAATATR